MSIVKKNKVLCRVNSFYEIDQQIEQERKNKIRRIIDFEYREMGNRNPIRLNTHEFTEYIFSNKTSYESTEHLAEDLRNLYVQVDKNFEKPLRDDFLSNTSEKIMRIINISDEEIFVAVLQRRLYAEFNMQINSIYHSGVGSEIALRIKDQEVKVSIFEDEHIKIDNSPT